MKSILESVLDVRECARARSLSLCLRLDLRFVVASCILSLTHQQWFRLDKYGTHNISCAVSIFYFVHRIIRVYIYQKIRC